MIDAMLKDSVLRPHLFIWRGALPMPAIESWEREQSLCAPSDLKQLWNAKGGGDIFESETILQPFGAPDYDLIGSVSRVFWARGLSTTYCVFHTGLWDSIFRKSDGALFSIMSKDLTQLSMWQDLDDWYGSLRQEYAERYDLGRSVR